MSEQKSDPEGLDEFAIIAKYFAPLSEASTGAVGLTDDGALLACENVVPGSQERLAVTTDTIVAGIHYFHDAPAKLVAQKLLRVNLSDLAAMGARPYAYNLSLAINDRVDHAWLGDFAAGLGVEQKNWGISLVGGDTVRTPGPVTLTVSMFGWVEPAKRLLRSNARPGDIIYVSGTIGDAGLGLKILRGEIEAGGAADVEFLKNRYYLPAPRTKLAAAIAELAGSGIDVSDGLVADLGHICQASGIGADVKLADIPFSEPARRVIEHSNLRDDACLDLIASGDDYELLFTVPGWHGGEVEAVCAGLKIPVSPIGTISASGGRVRILDTNGQEMKIETHGYKHF